MFKKKENRILAGVLAVLILVAVGFFVAIILIKNQSNSQNDGTTEGFFPETTYISYEDIATMQSESATDEEALTKITNYIDEKLAEVPDDDKDMRVYLMRTKASYLSRYGYTQPALDILSEASMYAEISDEARANVCRELIVTAANIDDEVINTQYTSDCTAFLEIYNAENKGENDEF